MKLCQNHTQFTQESRPNTLDGLLFLQLYEIVCSSHTLRQISLLRTVEALPAKTNPSLCIPIMHAAHVQLSLHLVPTYGRKASPYSSLYQKACINIGYTDILAAHIFPNHGIYTAAHPINEQFCHVPVRQAFLLLVRIHQCFLTDTVYHPGDAHEYLVYLMLINNTMLPRSTTGEEIKKKNVTPRNKPALVNLMNSGIDEQEQNSVTVPRRAAIIFAQIP